MPILGLVALFGISQSAWSGGQQPAVSARVGGTADTVLLNGKIHSQNTAREVFSAVAIAGNLIAAVGSDSSVLALKGPMTRVVDLRGRVVLPGIIDAHIHPASSALDLDKCDLADKPLSFDQVKAQVLGCLRSKPGDEKMWYEVVGVNPLGGDFTSGALDTISKRPLMLDSTDAHSVWLNSAALQAAHISRETPDPAGGTIERDQSGVPTGTLRESATLLAQEAKPKGALKYESDLLSKTLDEMRAVGITSLQDAAVDDHLMAIYKALYDDRRLKMRVRGSFFLKDPNASPASLVRGAEAFRARWAVDNAYLRADAVKIYADGVIEYPAHTAALLQPYLDANGKSTDDRGPTNFSPDALNQIVSAADRSDLTVHIHAIGDRAVRSALDAIEGARRANGVRDNRHQIAHLELIDPDDYPRFIATGTIANFQLLWAVHNPYLDQATIPFLGAARSQHLYPAGSLKRAGALIAGGSDWSVTSFNPFIAMEHGITRTTKRGVPALLPDEALTLQDMVDAYTINAATALRQEKISGSLEVGKRADFIVLDRDIFALDAYRLHETKVMNTWLDGNEVYQRPDAVGRKSR